MSMLIVGMVFNLVIGVPIAAIMLRASVSLANRFLGGADQPPQMQEVVFSESAVSSDPTDPYSAPTVVTAATDGTPEGVIPEPGFGHACGISLAQMMAGFLLSFAFGTVFRLAVPVAATVWGAVLFSFVISIPVYAGILSVLLPTTFRRSLLIMLCQMLIVGVVGIVIVGGMAAFGLFS